MVSHEGQRTPFPDNTQAFCRRGSITHDIAQAYDFLDLLLLDVGKHSFQSIDVAVDVGNKRNTGHMLLISLH